ncbi:MAG: UvrD-helicase domain-containing protein, partial [Pseudomonadota bacterium]
MKLIADLHIHSRFSRATARNLNLPTLDLWASKKGLAVIGTGDFTHPGWRAEIEEQLLPAEEGLFRLKPQLALDGGGETRFVLSVEISSIYKKKGQVRKVHNLILMPDLDAARSLTRRLATLGNVTSDGRPILGLDARDLLEICLDASPDVFFIPAHIWTPWFSLLGSRSGFDSVEECFEDLSEHVYALETGLSSDPPMNWRLASLDRYVLVSNSDAHSPDKLGREANLFDTDLSYPALVRAMMGQGGFRGTVEFFPEEGKYHLDGHRSCGRRLAPEETWSLGGLCPVCGKPVTVGVLNRVLELADRPAGVKPEGAYDYVSLVPLSEVLGEVLDVGPKSKRVSEVYEDLLQKLGPELFILQEAPLEDIAEAGSELLAAAVGRMRAGKVLAQAGYDGEFGRIRVFEPGERQKLCGQNELFPGGRTTGEKRAPGKVRLRVIKGGKSSSTAAPEPEVPLLSLSDPLLDDLNPEQREAVTFEHGPLGIVAGPGTGKTLVLTRRAAWLVREGLAAPEEILGLTFTRQAAGEMSERLAKIMPFRPDVKRVSIMTFHALGLEILARILGERPKVLAEEERLTVAKRAAKNSPFKAPELINLISQAKQKLKGPGDVQDEELARAYGRYEVSLAALGAVDFDDLVLKAVGHLSEDAGRAKKAAGYKWLLLDEYQDINQSQYQLTRLLAPGSEPDLTVIGDPDQAIYGFRGADSSFFDKFQEDFPQGRIVELTRNYRSTDTILKASSQVISHNPGPGKRSLISGRQGPAKVTT